MHFQISDFYDFWEKIKIERNCIQFSPKYSRSKIVQIPKYSLIFDTQNACLKRPYFDEIRYEEKSQNYYRLCARLREFL